MLGPVRRELGARAPEAKAWVPVPAANLAQGSVCPVDGMLMVPRGWVAAGVPGGVSESLGRLGSAQHPVTSGSAASAAWDRTCLCVLL